MDDPAAMDSYCRNLQRAVLSAATRDYVAFVRRHYDGVGHSPHYRERKITEIRVDARDWFLGDDSRSDWPFTLTNICKSVGVRATQIRGVIRTMEAILEHR
jgi:hypothetical protein